ncbi:hypothetical protein [Actinokineospora sp. NBRC 105648]|uniref:hypothetical protein n=1 Tax=Actinokineospora sp. NBRC 105648 TaxID=3032206 RepID=UPI0024A53890|nr:hypothetical protein [Actinokineospora sp. NBRC 105648]GLZ38362.1 hypothetical protein Acsp05_19860 [Actinokineospora sp. NBRC 105648]
MTSDASDMRDMVQINVTANLPIQVKALPFADRLEIRFGKAFPVALIVDAAALRNLADALAAGCEQLTTAIRELED